MLTWEQYSKRLKDIYQYIAEALYHIANAPHLMVSSVFSLDYARALRGARDIVFSFDDVVEQSKVFIQTLKEEAGTLDLVERKKELEDLTRGYISLMVRSFRILNVKADVALEQLQDYASSAKPEQVLLDKLTEIKNMTTEKFLALIQTK